MVERKPARKGKPLNMWISDELAERIEEYWHRVQLPNKAEGVRLLIDYALHNPPPADWVAKWKEGQK